MTVADAPPKKISDETLEDVASCVTSNAYLPAEAVAFTVVLTTFSSEDVPDNPVKADAVFNLAMAER
ncbi:hypothetical protein D3C87_1808490 [compost metagenome]